MSQSEEIKSKLDIVEVIREYIPVKAVGANFQALCPFHNEKSPSFVISPEKQIWHCFGCGRGGDVFAFVMEKEGLGFMEVLRLLAPKAGVVLQYENQQEYSERNRLLDILELAGKYYAHILSTPTGREAREYLIKRGLSDENIAEWQLGYSQDSWSGLYDFLKARPLTGKQYTDEEILSAGLTVKKETRNSGGRGYYDRFRDRIMFPIWNVNNNLIAFTARVNPNKEQTEKMGKYINSPQTKIYDKSRVLFGLNKAKSAIRQEDMAIVVEGQMDAISCHNHGFKNVVASSGTALTTEQVALIKRFTNNIALLFDMDAAGQMAADRGIKEALAQEMNLKIIVLSSGKDPDECLKNNPEEFKAAVLAAKPMLEYYFEKVSAGLDLNKLDNKRDISVKMFAMIDLVANRMEQGHWLKRLSEELGFSETDTREEFVKWRSMHGVLKGESARSVKNGQSASQKAENEHIMPEVSRDDKLAELLMSLLIKFPEFISYSVSNLNPAILNDVSLAKFYRNLIIYYNKAASLSYESFRAFLAEDGGGSEKTLDKLVLLGEKDFYDYTADQVKAEIINIIAELKKYSRQRQVHALQREIAAAEKAGDEGKLNTLMDELRKITAS